MKNTIYLVGIGPGEEQAMTIRARDILAACDVIVGYTAYVDLVKSLFPEKEYRTTPMRQEIERCRLCYELCGAGKKVAMICSGDAGVYGMAAPMYDLLPHYKETMNVELLVIPGVTAANSGAAILGAPLNHDYCVISLSDLLTPWERIEKRLKAAVWGDFAIAIYNPGSHKRADYLAKACDIMLEAGADKDLVCGYVENIGREGCKWEVCTLSELRTREVNMFTTVFIGNSQTSQWHGKMITPRGYRM